MAEADGEPGALQGGVWGEVVTVAEAIYLSPVGAMSVLMLALAWKVIRG